MPIVPFIPAIIGAGVGLYGASQASKSAKKGLQAQTEANDKSLEAQQHALDVSLGVNQRFLNGGGSAFDALLAEYGIGPSQGGGSAPNRTSVVGAQGMGGYGSAPLTSPDARRLASGVDGGGKTPGGFAGTSPLDIQTHGGDPYYTAPGQLSDGRTVPQGGGFDAAGYLRLHPDVAAGYQAYLKGTTDGFAQPDTQGQSWQDWGYQPGLTPEQFAEQHYNETGKAAGYEAPPNLPGPPPPPPAAPSPSNPPTDLVTAQRPQGPEAPTYTRPGDVAAPTFGDAPKFSNYFDPNNFTKDPSYQFRLKQGVDNANSGFAARGLLKSSAAAKGITDYASNLASQEYGNAFGRAQSLYNNDIGQYNNNRNFLQGNYEYGQNRQDQNFNTDRSTGLNLFTQQQARGDTNFNNDRNFQASRYDTRIGNLFDLAHMGTTAASNVSGATQNNANNQSSIFGSQANATADAANARAQANASAVGSLGAAAGNIFAGYGQPSGRPSADPFSDYSFYKGAF